mmetsp:Transcript_10772/g.32396  ORF Transcript_10772/g.32396 Transcript_10772/m.32396 type:complete len:253 (+) Transcript_10772:1654-2412(+)
MREYDSLIRGRRRRRRRHGRRRSRFEDLLGEGGWAVLVVQEDEIEASRSTEAVLTRLRFRRGQVSLGFAVAGAGGGEAEPAAAAPVGGDAEDGRRRVVEVEVELLPAAEGGGGADDGAGEADAEESSGNGVLETQKVLSLLEESEATGAAQRVDLVRQRDVGPADAQEATTLDFAERDVPQKARHRPSAVALVHATGLSRHVRRRLPEPIELLLESWRRLVLLVDLLADRHAHLQQFLQAAAQFFHVRPLLH